MRATLAEKLGVEMERYKVLGARNPAFAHEMLKICESSKGPAGN